MITLRLARAGSKKRPVYHLVAADRRARRDGRFVENLGYYIPGRKVLVVKQDRVEYWLSVGAQPTETARHVIRRARKAGPVEPQTPKKPEKEASEAKTEASEAKTEASEAPAASPEASASEASETEASVPKESAAPEADSPKPES